MSIEDGFSGPAPAGYPPAPEPRDAPFGADTQVTTHMVAQSHPSVAGAADGSWLLVAYTNQTGPTNQDVYVARSTNGGLSWTHVALAANAGYDEWDPVIIRHGTKVFVFYSHSDPALPYSYRWSESTNGGLSWSPQNINFGSVLRDFVRSDASTNGQWMYVIHETTCDNADPRYCPVSPLQVTAVHMYDVTGTKSGGTSYHLIYDGANYLDMTEPAISVGDGYTVQYADMDANNPIVNCDPGDRDIATQRVPTGQNVGTPWPWIDNYVWGICSEDVLRLDADAIRWGHASVFQFIDPAVTGIANHVIAAFSNPNNGTPADFVLGLVAGADGFEYKDPAISSFNPVMHVSFVAGADLGYTYSLDGGGSWALAMKVNASPGPVVDAVRSTGITYAGGVRVVWQDTRNTNDDIFYSTFSGWAFYIFDRSPRQGTLNIESVDVSLPAAYLRATGSSIPVIAPATDPVGPGRQLVFTNWSPDSDPNPTRTFTVGATDMLYTANYIMRYYLDISTTVTGGTVSTVPPGGPGWFDAGAAVDIYCNLPPSGADVRYSNPMWTGQGSGSYTGPVSNPDTILMNGPIMETCEATTQYRHTYDTLPTGLNIIVDGSPTPVVAPQTFWWDEGTSHTVLCVTPQGPGTQQYVFNHWDPDNNLNNPRTWSSVASAGTFVCVYTSEFQWTFDSNPAACEYEVDGVPYTGTRQLYLAEGSTPTVSMTDPQPVSPNQRYMFGSWSDGGQKSHALPPISGSGSLTLNCMSQFRYRFDSTPSLQSILVDGIPATTRTGDNWWNESTSHTVEFPPAMLTTNSRRAFLRWGDGSGANPRLFVAPTDTPGDYMIETVIEYRFNVATNPVNPTYQIRVDNVLQSPPHEEWWRDGTSHWVQFVNIDQTDVRQWFARWQDNDLNNPRTFVAGTTAAGDYTIFVDAWYRYQFYTYPDPGSLQLRINGTDMPSPVLNLWWREGESNTVEFRTQTAGTVRYVFDEWTGGDPANPRTFVAGTAPAGIYYVNITVEYQFVFTTSPAGSPVYTDDTPCPTTCTVWWPEGSSHSVEFRNVSISAGTQRVFDQWADGVNSNPRTFSNVAAAGAFTVNTKLQHELTVTSAHGTVTGADWYDEGTQATVTLDQQFVAGATGERFRFDGWTGDASGTSLSVTITMNAPKAATATWVTQYELTVTSAHGVVTGAGWYDTGTTATATLDIRTTTPSAGVQYRFNRWTGDASGTDLTSSSITMNAPKAVVAEWVTQYAITVVTSPLLSGLQADIVIGGTSYDMQGGVYYVDSGTSYEVRVPAEVSSGGKTYKFVSWDASTGTATAAATHTATFREVGLFESPIVLIGIIVVILVVVLLIVLLLLRRRKKPEETAEPAAGAPGEAGAAMMTCPSCGKSIPSVAGPCPECGAEIALE